MKGRRLHDIQHDYFNNIDSAMKAYLLGFFIADGYIEKNSGRICFNNSIDDISIIKEIQKQISPNSKLLYSKIIWVPKIEE